MSSQAIFTFLKMRHISKLFFQMLQGMVITFYATKRHSVPNCSYGAFCWHGFKMVQGLSEPGGNESLKISLVFLHCSPLTLLTFNKVVSLSNNVFIISFSPNSSTMGYCHQVFTSFPCSNHSCGHATNILCKKYYKLNINVINILHNKNS